jgi:predicted small lipoprotein YifL
MRSPLTRFVCLALLLAALAGCGARPRLRQANVDQVQAGMAKKQVESILGLPDETQAEALDLAAKKVTYIYKQGNDKVTIVFWDDKVESITGRLSI